VRTNESADHRAGPRMSTCAHEHDARVDRFESQARRLHFPRCVKSFHRTPVKPGSFNTVLAEDVREHVPPAVEWLGQARPTTRKTTAEGKSEQHARRQAPTGEAGVGQAGRDSYEKTRIPGNRDRRRRGLPLSGGISTLEGAANGILSSAAASPAGKNAAAGSRHSKARVARGSEAHGRAARAAQVQVPSSSSRACLQAFVVGPTQTDRPA